MTQELNPHLIFTLLPTWIWQGIFWLEVERNRRAIDKDTSG